MMDWSDVAIIMPSRAVTEERARNVAFTTARWKYLFPEAELLVMDDGGNDRPTFNKNRAINRAVAATQRNFFVVTDADALVPCAIQQAIEESREHDFTIPWSSAYWLPEEVTRPILQAPVDAEYSTDTFTRHRGFLVCRPGIPALLYCMSRTLYDRLRGLDERCDGWWCDDVALSNLLCGYGIPVYRPVSACPVAHLYHQGLSETRAHDPAARLLNAEYLVARKHGQHFAQLVTMRQWTYRQEGLGR